MITRRHWLISSSGSIGLSVMPAMVMRAANAHAVPDAGPSRGAGSLTLELTGMHEGTAPALRRCLASSGCMASDPGSAMDIRSSALAHGWYQDSLRVHSRYVPEAAAGLGGIEGLPPAVARESPGCAAGEGERMAVTLGTEQFAVLVNRAKMGAAGVSNATLDAFERGGLRARFLISSWGGVGDSGWVFPLLAHHLDMQPGHQDAGDLLLSDAGLHGLARLHGDVMRRLDIVKEPSPWNDAQYEALVDPSKKDVAAVYGNPLRLQRVLAAAGRQVDIDIVPMGDFLGLPVVDMHRIQVLQIGTGVKDPAFAREAMVPLVNALDGLTARGDFSDCAGVRCVPEMPMSTATESHTAGAGRRTDRYAGILRLEFWTDRAFGVQLVDTLARAARHYGASDKAALVAASTAFQALSAYEAASSGMSAG